MRKYIAFILSLVAITQVKSQTFVAEDLGEDHMTCITSSIKGDFVITAGRSNGFGFTDQDIVYQRTDLKGNVLWSKHISHLGIDEPKDILACTDSNFVLVGSFGKAGGTDFL